MRIGDLLVEAGLVSREDIARASAEQARTGNRLGDTLVAMGALSQAALAAFFAQLPQDPPDLGATGIPAAELLNLLLKQIYTMRLEQARQIAEAIKLPPHIVDQLIRMATDRGLVQALPNLNGQVSLEMRYGLTDLGRRWAQDALAQSQYGGPAPVTLAQFTARVHLQKVTTEAVTPDRLRQAFAGLTISETFLQRIGPALSAGRAILLYGPPGNGKTSVALRLAEIFTAVIYLPYAIMVEGQIIRIFDPSFHRAIAAAEPAPEPGFASLRREQYDARWVPCRRPFVVVGGEMTLEMLDLSYDPVAKFYEAPLHVKALGGCFLIDDFGRQLVTPETLLNRWIVPLENQIDYLKLHTGKSFSVPFEELVIFSTNLAPEELMDPAFLRRLPYKLEVSGPSREEFKRIFAATCAAQNLPITDAVFDVIVHKIREEKGLQLAAYQPRFIVDQVVAASRFLSIAPEFRAEFIAAALDNLQVRDRARPAAAAV